jgi:hypothetical protein
MMNFEQDLSAAREVEEANGSESGAVHSHLLARILNERLADITSIVAHGKSRSLFTPPVLRPVRAASHATTALALATVLFGVESQCCSGSSLNIQQSS